MSSVLAHLLTQNSLRSILESWPMQCKFYMAIGVNGQRMISLVSWMNLQVCILTHTHSPPPKKTFPLPIVVSWIILILVQMKYQCSYEKYFEYFFFILKILQRNGWQRMWHTYLSFAVMLLHPKCWSAKPLMEELLNFPRLLLHFVW